jgi:hypothetical protein
MPACPKIKNYRSGRFKKFIRSKRSLKSDREGTPEDPIVASHQNFGMCGTALKSPDIFCVPLLHSEHSRQEHQKGHKTFWGNENLELRCLEYIAEFLSLNKGKKI